jgi:hypothetical protein
MNDEQDPLLAVLQSIDASLKTLVVLSKQRAAKAQASAPKTVASDKDLDGKYGNPRITFNPRDWTGESFKGRRMADCSSDFLDMLAETLDYFAGKAEESGEEYKGKPVAPYKRADAARARGWAKRIREGKHTPAASDSSDSGWTEDGSQADGWS